MNRPGIRRITVLTILAAGLLVAGCGGSGGSSTSTTATTSATSATTTSSAVAPTSTTGGGTAAPSGTLTALKLAASPSGSLSYDTTTLRAKAGKVTILFTNTSPLSHDVTVESSTGTKLGATPIFTGGTRSLTLSLKAGTYTFYCSVPGHRQAGMQGTLTVG